MLPHMIVSMFSGFVSALFDDLRVELLIKTTVLISCLSSMGHYVELAKYRAFLN